jgi:Fe2+ or Zn2+ uptake regulation protein
LIAGRYVSSDHTRKIYRLSDNSEPFHFTCRGCGRVTVVRSGMIDALKRDLATRLGAEAITLCCCAGGLCADCQEEDES